MADLVCETVPAPDAGAESWANFVVIATDPATDRTILTVVVTSSRVGHGAYSFTPRRAYPTKVEAVNAALELMTADA